MTDGEPPDARATLLEALAAVDRRIDALTVEFDLIVAATESANTDDEHDPEGSTIAFERAQVASLRDDALARRASIERALLDIDAGTYGTCIDCGTHISVERLEAIPGTNRCASCAAAVR